MSMVRSNSNAMTNFVKSLLAVSNEDILGKPGPKRRKIKTQKRGESAVTRESTAASGWVKLKGKKKKKSTSKKAKASKKLVSKIKKVVHREIDGQIPHGIYTRLATANARGSTIAQVSIGADSFGLSFQLCDLGTIMDAAAVMFNGKASVYNGGVVTTGNFPIDTPIMLEKAYCEIRIVNSEQFAIDVDFYEYDCKVDNNVNSGAVGLWSTGYNQINYQSFGTTSFTGLGENDLYAHPGETPQVSEYYSSKKKSFTLLPGAEEKLFFRGRGGSYLPSRWATTTSTVGIPVLNLAMKGRTKQFQIMFRSRIAPYGLGPAYSASTQHAGHSLAFKDLTSVGVEIKHTYRVLAPEGTAVANRVRTVSHNYFMPALAVGGFTEVVDYDNPVVPVSQ